ncbi:MAG: hypothetical protein IJ728_04350 [Selenomonadaceae bacterium]|nr:hypothetical protein [Selenomonadaceae bacterium]
MNINKKFLAAGLILSALTISFPLINAEAAPANNKNISAAQTDSNWYFLSADDKYGKFFEPGSVKVVKKVTTADGKEIPTEIEAWTKTTYTYEGAMLTIDNYDLRSILTDPQMLSYSLALLRINPQNRTIQYAREDFYDANGKLTWSTTDEKIKEINVQSFDEVFYAAIVDEVFRNGEMDRKNAKDRWIDLWNATDENGNTTTVTADTTTMRLKGSNLILWEWQETKNAEGKVIEIRFMKKAVNLSQGTEKISTGDVWTPQSAGWNTLEDENGGAYKMIRGDAPEYKGLVRLRAFAKGYSNWVSRYSID